MFLLGLFTAMEIMAETECHAMGVYNTTSVLGNCYIFSVFPRKIPILISIHCERERSGSAVLLECSKPLRASRADPVAVLLCADPSDMALVVEKQLRLYPGWKLAPRNHLVCGQF